MFSIAVCDDEPLHAAHTRDVILRCGNIDFPLVRLFETADALIEEIGTRNYCPQIAVLDIRMAGIDGIKLAARINEALPHCAVIFLTAFLEYATDVYNTRHVYFILKGELEQRIEGALKKALEQMDSEQFILISSSALHKKIPIDDILYMERNLHKTTLQTKSGQELVYTAPADLLKSVPEGTFIRCHQSYWANYRHITAMEKNEFIMTDGAHIPISRTFRDSAKNAFFRCMRNR